MNALIVSTSKIYGSPYLAYLEKPVKTFFKDKRQLLFIPFARPGGITWDAYTALAAEKFAAFGLTLKGIHEFENMSEALKTADGVFTGGGNTFLLLKTLYEHNLVAPLASAVKSGQIAYMGSSAGSNITGLTIGTTNDMPIVHPPSLDALQLLPVNINPHYLDPIADSTHMGETREQRITEFHHCNDQHVWGLREGSWLHVRPDNVTLEGPHTARLFRKGQAPLEIAPGEINLTL
jgi:dipeptidase E